MEMLSVSQYAEQNGISERTVRNWCATGKMEGATLVGKTWNIPADAPLPRKGKPKESPLLKRLREEKEGKDSPDPEDRHFRQQENLVQCWGL